MSPQIIWFENLGSLGIVKDTHEQQLPPNAWTTGQNMRFREDSVLKIAGEQAVFGTPTAAPYFALPIAKGPNYWWVYGGLNDIYATNGTSHYCVTDTGGTASAAVNVAIGWNGGLMGGGVGILNNGVLAPLSFTGSTSNTAWAKLANWPAGMIARCLRPFKQTLVAWDIDEGSGRDGTLLRWSHPAAVGAVPASWDYTNTAYSAGRTNLSQGGDFIVEGEPLRDSFFIYKENSTWSMQYVGGNSIYAFRREFDQLGIMSRRCVKEFFGKHVVLSLNDVVIHDGQTVTQFLSNKWKRYLFNSIDGTYYYSSFVVVDYPYEEVWICYPEIGYTLPNKAIIWNWRDNTTSIRELPTGTAHIERGIVDTGSDFTIAGDSSTYENASGIFDEQSYNASSRYLLMCDANLIKFYRGDTSTQFHGNNITATIERNALPIGSPKPDFTRIKYVNEIWPVIHGTAGGVVNIYLGLRDSLDDPTSWKGPFAYTIGTTVKIDVAYSARIFDIRFTSTTNIDWTLERYGLKVRIAGLR
jgi:hypothetical protein